MLTGFRFLQSVNINTLVQTLDSRLELAQPLRFLSRLPIVNAEDDEIFGRYSGQVFAADIIADDQEAVVYEGGQVVETFVPGTIPKIKMGARVGEGMIRRLARLADKINLEGPDADIITGWENQLANRLVQGIRVRQNAMACAMMLDDFVYDRLGIKIQGSWGMPADLKMTPVTPWNNTAATPISDLELIAQEVAPDVHGQVYDRVTMSRAAFRFLIQTDEFKERARFLYRYDVPEGAFNFRDIGTMGQLFTAMTGLNVEFEDTTFRVRNSDGSVVQTRVMPANKVILSNTNDDNDPAVMDFANGIVIESVVAPLFNADAAAFMGGEQFGPVAYYTGNQNLNPPDLSAWAVVRGFPRKHVETATAVLTVGLFS